MERIVFRSVGSVFGTGNIQIHDDRLLAAAHDDCLDRLVFARVQFLMRNVGRNVDEISRAGFIDKLQIISPAKAGAAAYHVDDGFEFSVMMGPVLALGWTTTVPAQSFCAPTRAREMASARVMPGVCGVLPSSSPLRMMRRPRVFQSGISFS